MSDIQKLKAVLIGCGGMGGNQARILAKSEYYDLLAVADLDQARAEKLAAELNCRAYGDAKEMLETEKPEVVSVPASNVAHAPMTILAAQMPGVLGVYCEKPMAMNMKEAREMVEACKKNKVALVINHQRRIGHDLMTARKLIEDGAIGEVRLLRGQCAGDILSDGTHLIDSCMYLLGDPKAEWVLGQLHREIDDAMLERAAKQREKGQPGEAGFRFGHPVENGGMAEIGLGGNLRFEILCGDMREENRIYQDYEIFGTEGRIWRTGDGAKPNLYIQDAQGGDWSVGVDDKWLLRPLSPEESGGKGKGGWRPVEIIEGLPKPHIDGAYERFYRMIRDGEDHPMNGDIALQHFEMLMAIYESARLSKKITLPLEQDRFPLEVMIEDGRA